jgi:MFS transporter, MHS family, proline/betaine transporter
MRCLLLKLNYLTARQDKRFDAEPHGSSSQGQERTRILQPQALDSWGWRVPFLIGLAIGPVGLFIRRHLEETEAFRNPRTTATVPPSLAATAAAHLKETFVCMGLIPLTFGTISFYVILVYMPTFARTQLRLQLDDAFLAQSISLVCMIVLIPPFGALADRIGRKPILIGALGLYLLIAYPLFDWLHSNPRLLVCEFGDGTDCAVRFARRLLWPISTTVAEQFAMRTRSTGLGIAYNLAVMIFGGFAQFFVTWFVEVTGSPVAPSFLLLFGAAVGLAATLVMVDRARETQLPALEGISLAVKSS